MLPTGPIEDRSAKDAATTPADCAKMYRTTSAGGNRRTDQKAIVTAGLMCAPERCPVA